MSVRARARRSGALAFFGLLSACATTSSPAASRLHAALAKLCAAEDLYGGRVGVVVLDASDGRVLLDHWGHRGFATASNMKILSSAVALQTLGPDYCFSTELVRRGPVREGVLHGDLILRGHGDPTFGEDPRDLDAMVEAVREAGITRVEGDVVGDGSFLGDEVRGHGWQWDHLEAAYAAPFGGLCLGGNVVSVRLGPDGGIRDYRPRGSVRPTSSAVPGEETDLRVLRPLGSDEVEIRGTVASDDPGPVVRVAVNDPVSFASSVLRERLRASGIPVAGLAVAPVGEPEVRIVDRRSEPVRAIVRPLLLNSNNLYAEQFFRVSAREATGDGSSRAAAAHASKVLSAKGIDCRGMVLADGSGLSRRDLVQPHQIAELLLAMYHSPLRDVFVAGLPVAGRTGTLRRRFPEGSPAHGRVRAKTGFLSRVVCLSGYVSRPDPAAPPLVFSVMLNDFVCGSAGAKKACDAFVEELCAFAGW